MACASALKFDRDGTEFGLLDGALDIHRRSLLGIRLVFAPAQESHGSVGTSMCGLLRYSISHWWDPLLPLRTGCQAQIQLQLHGSEIVSSFADLP